ncbi:unnamed protein product [Ambrosiozyma monospora]|uniref:Unnamed protein product n=1 Tax=Ambrosiozyma monospora TaxID=43982 RepID=A0A9W6Z6U4_AMBMO|nr:unnamed protein product [Ambrosiozyma monospora]
MIEIQQPTQLDIQRIEQWYRTTHTTETPWTNDKWYKLYNFTKSSNTTELDYQNARSNYTQLSEFFNAGLPKQLPKLPKRMQSIAERPAMPIPQSKPKTRMSNGTFPFPMVLNKDTIEMKNQGFINFTDERVQYIEEDVPEDDGIQYPFPMPQRSRMGSTYAASIVSTSSSVSDMSGYANSVYSNSSYSNSLYSTPTVYSAGSSTGLVGIGNDGHRILSYSQAVNEMEILGNKLKPRLPERQAIPLAPTSVPAPSRASSHSETLKSAPTTEQLKSKPQSKQPPRPKKPKSLAAPPVPKKPKALSCFGGGSGSSTSTAVPVATRASSHTSEISNANTNKKSSSVLQNIRVVGLAQELGCDVDELKSRMKYVLDFIAFRVLESESEGECVY